MFICAENALSFNTDNHVGNSFWGDVKSFKGNILEIVLLFMGSVDEVRVLVVYSNDILH